MVDRAALGDRLGTVPSELALTPRRVLETYVRDRLLLFGQQPVLAQRLGLPQEHVTAAVTAAVQDLYPGHHAAAGGLAQDLLLVFRHDCQNLGCMDPGCKLCEQNPRRRCTGNFAEKYLAGDPLKAKCGAAIRVEVIDQDSNEAVLPENVGDISLEMCVLDGKAYQTLQEAGREGILDEVLNCVLLANNQNKELLAPGRGGTHRDMKVVVQLQRTKAHLPELSITGSSEALLSGHKPSFRLLVQAVNSAGEPVDHIRFAVSEAFRVATPRVRGAVKAEIPHLDDPVKMLEAVGVMTLQKLENISEAARAVGVTNLHVPQNSVETVGQFRALTEWAEQDKAVCETLKRVLKLTRGWDVARDHARMAVGTDSRMRLWYAADGQSGLLYKCNLGSVELDQPVALLSRSNPSDPNQMEAIMTPQLTGRQRDTMKSLQRKALVSWWETGHPGWRIWERDTETFMRSVHTPSGNLVETLPGRMQPPAAGATRAPTAPAAAASGAQQPALRSQPQQQLPTSAAGQAFGSPNVPATAAMAPPSQMQPFGFTGLQQMPAGAVPMDALPSQQQMDGTRQHSWAQFAATAGGGAEALGQQSSSHLMQALMAQRMESQGVALPGSTAGPGAGLFGLGTGSGLGGQLGSAGMTLPAHLDTPGMGMRFGSQAPLPIDPLQMDGGAGSHLPAGAGGSGSVDGFGSSLYGSGLQSGSSPPGSARSNVKIEGGSSGGTGQSATLAQGQGLLVPITPGWDQGLQQPAPGSQPMASGPYQPFGSAPLEDAAGTSSRSGSLQGLQNRSGSGKAQPPPSPFGNPDQQNTLIPQAQGGSKKRGADIAGMPSKRSNLADRLGPAGMSTLAVLLGHDVTQADLDRLQQAQPPETSAAQPANPAGQQHRQRTVKRLRQRLSALPSLPPLEDNGVDTFVEVFGANFTDQLLQNDSFVFKGTSGGSQALDGQQNSSALLEVPNSNVPESSRQLTTGYSYGRTLHRGDDGQGGSGKSDGLQSMQSIEDALVNRH